MSKYVDTILSLHYKLNRDNYPPRKAFRLAYRSLRQIGGLLSIESEDLRSPSLRGAISLNRQRLKALETGSLMQVSDPGESPYGP